jgi:hypothetical protein
MSHRSHVAILGLILAAALGLGSAEASQAATSGDARAPRLAARGWVEALWAAAGLPGLPARLAGGQTRSSGASTVRPPAHHGRFLVDAGLAINPDGTPAAASGH